MRICIDLDGVISELKKEGESYYDVKPVKGAVEKIKKLKENGHYIIIYTARHMKTCNGNVAQVLAKVGGITLEWLNKYEIPYDEIVFGKPWADIYIDDNGFRFKTWDEIDDNGKNLPKSHEKSVRGDE
ncbi:MAG TPA: capsular biosynthesis protein [Piscirickettsiaceae bacterium]|nr:capsular biosynthesis protein [Piscirickettsiaceae bacterium]